MTELERILLDNLKQMEKDIAVALEARSLIQTEQGQALEEQLQTLAAQAQALKRLQAENSQMNADLRALTERLQAWGALCASLEVLLPRLQGILSDNGR
jgi:septal ring factor EnvC (AmiA/AmiB activator)